MEQNGKACFKSFKRPSSDPVSTQGGIYPNMSFTLILSANDLQGINEPTLPSDLLSSSVLDRNTSRHTHLHSHTPTLTHTHLHSHTHTHTHTHTHLHIHTHTHTLHLEYKRTYLTPRFAGLLGIQLLGGELPRQGAEMEVLKKIFRNTVSSKVREYVKDYCRQNGLLTLSVFAVLTGCVMGFALRSLNLSTQVDAWSPRGLVDRHDGK